MRLPACFIPHGAGPCFFMDWQPAGLWEPMAHWLRQLATELPEKPVALLVISAHWEAAQPTVNGLHRQGLLFDYGGFPAHTYALTWPAPQAPDLAQQVVEALSAAGFTPQQEEQRGLDHGVFVPLKLVFPEADIPVVQLSLIRGLSPEQHVAMGQALAPLREAGVLIIGSGMSYHNMRHLQHPDGRVDEASQQFDDWLRAVVALPRDEREQALNAWSTAPGARVAHPREEHLIPLHVIAGAAGDDKGEGVFRDVVLGSVQSGFRFG